MLFLKSCIILGVAIMAATSAPAEPADSKFDFELGELTNRSVLIHT